MEDNEQGRAGGQEWGEGQIGADRERERNLGRYDPTPVRVVKQWFHDA